MNELFHSIMRSFFMQKNIYLSKRLTKSRIIKVSIAFLIFLSYLIYNLFSLQLINNAYYQNKVYDQITTSAAMKAKRGVIYDSNMNILATDKTVWRVFVSSREIKKQEKETKQNYTEIIARGLSDILSLRVSFLFTNTISPNITFTLSGIPHNILYVVYALTSTFKVSGMPPQPS